MKYPLSNGERPIGMLVKVYPKLSETFILEEILGLERLQVPLHLYALAPPTDSVTHPAVGRVRAALTYVPTFAPARVGQFATRHLRLLCANPLRYVRSLYFAAGRGWRGLDDFLRAGWLAQQLQADGVQHLHTHFLSTPADVAELVGQLSTVRCSLSAHAKDIYLSEPADLRRKLEAALFTVTCTEMNRQTLASIAPRASIHRMYHGIDHALFHPCQRRPPEAVPLILAVGRLREKKGLDTLIEACRVLRAGGQAFRCEIVGYGEQREALQALIVQHGLAEQVFLVGTLPREQVIERYARAAVFVQPSRIAADGDRDGIPNVLLEAMAMGLPVVASRVSGIPELVGQSRNGLLVEPDQAQALADAVKRLLQDPRLCAELGHNARKTVTEWFDNDRNLLLLCHLLETNNGYINERASIWSTASNTRVDTVDT